MSGAFVKPSSVTIESGAYSYKGTLPSPAQNYIDNSFPDLASLSQNQTFTGTDNFNGSVNFNGLTAVTDAFTVSSGNITMLSGTTLQVDSGTSVYLLGTTSISLLGPFGLSFISTSSSTYNATTTDCVILCVTASIPITVVLPAPSNGRFVVVKDQSQNATSNHITILPHASENIDGVSSETILTNSGCFQYISDGTNWHSIAKI